MKARRRAVSVFAVFAAVMVIGMAIGTPALAPERSGPVGDSEALATATAVGITAIGSSVVGALINDYVSDLGWSEGQDESVTDDDETTKTDLFNTLEQAEQSYASIHTSKQQTLKILNNSIEGSSGNAMDQLAFQKARVSYARALTNNSTKQEAWNAANETLESYYVAQQKNLINTHTHHLERLSYIRATYQGHPDYVCSQLEYDHPVNGVEAVTSVDAIGYELVDGSTYMGKMLNDNSEYFKVNSTGPIDDTIQFSKNTGGGSCSRVQVAYKADGPSYGGNWKGLKDSYNVAQSNINLLVNNTYDGYEDGDLNESDILGPAAMYSELSTGANSSNQGQASLALAYMGYNGSIDNQIQLRTNSSNGQEWYNGTLFTDWKPAGTNDQFESGAYYTPFNGSATMSTGSTHVKASSEKLVYVASDSGNILRVNETFEVYRITDVETGETVKNVTTVEHVETTINKTSINESVFDRLESLQTELAKVNDGGGGGGGVTFGGVGAPSMAVAVAIVALLAFAAKSADN